MTISGSGQNVGIGTTTPDTALDIVSTTLPQLRIAYNDANYMIIEMIII